jgi:hypothetical protein
VPAEPGSKANPELGSEPNVRKRNLDVSQPCIIGPPKKPKVPIIIDLEKNDAPMTGKEANWPCMSRHNEIHNSSAILESKDESKTFLRFVCQ